MRLCSLVDELLMLRALFGIAMAASGAWARRWCLRRCEGRPRHVFRHSAGGLRHGVDSGFRRVALLFHWIGWRGLFMVGAAPALLVFYVQSRVAESPVWIEAAKKRLARTAAAHTQTVAAESVTLLKFLPTFLFLILLMTAFMSFSHGTQDVYPTFLLVEMKLSRDGGVDRRAVRVWLHCGGIVFWHAVRKVGAQAGDCDGGVAGHPGDSTLCVWTFGGDAGHGRGADAVHGAGAWGVVPAYLTELSPAPVRPRRRG